MHDPVIRVGFVVDRSPTRGPVAGVAIDGGVITCRLQGERARRRATITSS